MTIFLILSFIYNKPYSQKYNSFNHNTKKRLNTLKYFNLWPRIFLGNIFIFNSTCIL